MWTGVCGQGGLHPPTHTHLLRWPLKRAVRIYWNAYLFSMKFHAVFKYIIIFNNYHKNRSKLGKKEICKIPLCQQYCFSIPNLEVMNMSIDLPPLLDPLLLVVRTGAMFINSKTNIAFLVLQEY